MTPVAMPHKTLYAVFGSPIGHSLSPIMHNYALAQCGIHAEYCAFEVTPDNLGDAIRGVRALGIRGVNCTIPLKELIHAFVDDVDPDAAMIGACNTIHNEDGRLRAYNTDIRGFLNALGGREESWENQGAVIFGAGGSARAVLYALQKYTGLKSIALINRTAQRAEALARTGESWGSAELSVCPADNVAAVGDLVEASVALINTTSLGMAPQEQASPLPDPHRLHAGQTVVDLVYMPQRTRLLQQAADQGAHGIGGLEMLIRQGAESFEIWTRKKMPVDAVRGHIMSFLQQS